MARLPSELYVMQQADGVVRLFEDGSEQLVVSFDPSDGGSVEVALEAIGGSALGDEDRCFAWFWVGYFHAHAPRVRELARETFVTEADDGTVTVMDGTAVVVSFDPRNANAAARAQLPIHVSALSADDKARAHFWSGFAYAHANWTY